MKKTNKVVVCAVFIGIALNIVLSYLGALIAK